MNSKKRNLLLYSIIYMLIGLGFMINLPSGLGKRELIAYIFVIISYFITIGAFLICIQKNDIYLFEPIALVTALYFMMFCFAPIYNIINNTSDIWGYDVMDGAIKGIFIYTVSYLVFLFSYYRKRIEAFPQKYLESEKCILGRIKTVDFNRSSTLKVALFIYVISYGILLVNSLQSGASLSYFFSFGSISNDQEFNIHSAGGAFAVLNNMVYCLFPTSMYLMYLASKKWQKIIIFMISFIPIYLRGFRNFIIAFILMPIAFYYIQEAKIPKLRKVVIFLAAIFIGITYIELTRVQIATGSSSNIPLSNFSFERMWQSVQGNFDLYKSLYGAVIAFPKKINFFFGEQMIGSTLYTMIPRILWESKPDTPFVRTLQYAVGYKGSISGWAAPNLYEYYIDFGTIGCLVFMYLFGVFCWKLKSLYVHQKKGVSDIIAYVSLYPLLIQLVLRGYTPINFYMLAFIFITLYCVRNIRV